VGKGFVWLAVPSERASGERERVQRKEKRKGVALFNKKSGYELSVQTKEEKCTRSQWFEFSFSLISKGGGETLVVAGGGQR